MARSTISYHQERRGGAPRSPGRIPCNEPGFGLLDYNARYYDAGLGRFISPDTIVPEPGNPQSFNRYTYAANSPLKFVDRDGHCHGLAGAAFNICARVVLAVAPAVHQANEYREDIFFPDANTTTMDRIEASTVVGAGATAVAAGVVEAVAGTLTTVATTGGVATAGGTGGTVATTACGDGDCTNELGSGIRTLEKAKIIYDNTLGPFIHGTTDKAGNIRLNPALPRAERLRTLYHEQVHSYFTPRGPLAGTRQNISMWAYNNSALLRYTEEAIAQTRANLLTGRSVREGLLFPVQNGYVRPQEVLIETGGLGAGIGYTANRLANWWDGR